LRYLDSINDPAIRLI
jgi:hypothetical protein